MRFIVPIIFAAALVASGGGAAAAVAMSAAISLKAPLTEAARAFREQTGQTVELNFGATGRLLAQIKAGAPVDAFLAASSEQMDRAVTQRLVDPASRTEVAGNRLVLIAPLDGAVKVESFKGLGNPAIRRLAIGEPRTVPAGYYAQQVLRSLKLPPDLSERIVHASSVRQALDYVERGEVDAGIVYATDLKQSRGKVREVAVADADWHEPIRYVAATVSDSPRAAEAAAFIRFLTSAAGQRIFAAHGFFPTGSRAGGSAASQPFE